MRQVALDVHLRLFTVGGSGERYDPKDPRTDPSREGFDDAALARSVPTFEEDANLLAFVANPLLQLDELNVQLAELVLVFLALQLRLSAPHPGQCPPELPVFFPLSFCIGHFLLPRGQQLASAVY